jgi:hypothetical protein
MHNFCHELYGVVVRDLELTNTAWNAGKNTMWGPRVIFSEFSIIVEIGCLWSGPSLITLMYNLRLCAL